MLALLPFHNEMRYLPGWFRNVAPVVDGVIALDDGSTDGSRDFAAAQPSVLELIRLPKREPHVWDEPRNKRLLYETAAKYAPDWLVVVDSDERLERDFRQRARAAIALAEAQDVKALIINIREMWDSYEHFRVDGIWGQKGHARLFRYRRDAELDPRPFHGQWAPLNSLVHGVFPHADLELYHLRMIEEASRQKRRARYEALDPNRQHQAIGYSYLTDAAGLVVQSFARGRHFDPPGLGT